MTILHLAMLVPVALALLALALNHALAWAYFARAARGPLPGGRYPRASAIVSVRGLD